MTTPEQLRQEVQLEMARLDRAMHRMAPGTVNADIAFTLGFLYAALEQVVGFVQQQEERIRTLEQS